MEFNFHKINSYELNKSQNNLYSNCIFYETKTLVILSKNIFINDLSLNLKKNILLMLHYSINEHISVLKRKLFPISLKKAI